MMRPQPMTETLQQIEKIYEFCDASFTTVLLNLYRDGKDRMGGMPTTNLNWGKTHTASVSLGAPRFFHLRHNHDSKQRYKLLLEHGSLLLMGRNTTLLEASSCKNCKKNWPHKFDLRKVFIQTNSAYL